MLKNIKDFLKNEGKNACFLYGQKENILAIDPIEKFVGQDLEKFQKFAIRHKKHKLIGYFSYDLGYKLHNIKKTSKTDQHFPQIYFLAFKKWNKEKTTENASKFAEKFKIEGENFKPTFSKEKYKNAFGKIQKYIKDGDIYQINLTHRLRAKLKKPGKESSHQIARKIFLKTIANNTVDYAAYLECDGFELICASPERFVLIEKGKIETCPIKGTRKRGKTKEEDEKMKAELLKSEKEKAELNMITDLLRNDIGKIAAIGSVKVVNERVISKLKSVWHTHSKITARLKKGISAIKALISMLPGGSITGCPKKRAMEIIDELEPHTRGIYTGNIGYIDGDKIDMNIAIRTIIKKGENLFLQVGGGIVIDSKEKDEYNETLDKAKSFMNIIDQ
ncbi:anthranilate synthase component I family protein [Candidatus Peregrinibacteria bacterium]|nr:anthranilate synthase component I family protein [Candidatus Peregrinibacteria bacterium]